MVKSGIRIRRRLLCIGKILALCRIERAATKWFGWRVWIEVFSEQKLTRLWIAHEHALFVVGLPVFQIERHRSVLRSRLFFERASETVNKVVRVDRIAVGPATGVAQVESELGRVVVYVPAFGECRIGRECLRVVF